MPTDTHRFPTDGPVHLHLRSGRGSVQVLAGDTAETVVEVTSRHDAPQARVSASDDGRRVTVDVRHRRLGNTPRLEIVVRIPTASTVDLGTASASITTRGVLARVDAKTASGLLSIEQVDGACSAHSASGQVELGTVGGTVSLKSASGDLRVARAGDACRARTASGAIDIGWAGDLVTASSASGDVTVRDAARGEVSCKSTSGDVAIGVRKGTLVWLDLTTVSGRTTQALVPEDAPPTKDERLLRVKAQTVSGNITISPSGADAAAA
jgi:DUF4097 and DUF4098 domain-containing protein YvlB